MGSKRIGTGTYGCVYKPSLSCDDGSFDSSDDYVSKLMNGEEADNEEKMMDKVKQLDPNGIFHYPIVKKCHSNFQPIKCNKCGGDSNCLETCCDSADLQRVLKLKRQYPKDNFDTGLLIYKEGGRDLESYLQTASSSPKAIISDITSFYQGLWRLFFGLFVIHNNDSYHLDIKPANIMVKQNLNDYDIRFIDFGFLYTAKELDDKLPKRELDYFFKDYLFHTPQARLLITDITNYYMPPTWSLDKRVNKMKEIVNHKLDIRNKIMDLYYYFPRLKEYYTNPSFDEYNKTIDEDVNMFMSDQAKIYIRQIYTRIDIYMLGFCLKAIIAEIRASNPRGKDLVFTEKIDELANDMHAMNISKRIGPRKAFARYIKLVNSIYGVNMSSKFVEAVKLIPPERQRLFDASLRRRRNRRLRK